MPIVAVIAYCSHRLSEPPDPATARANRIHDMRTTAAVDCEDLVKQRLKAPSTASFPYSEQLVNNRGDSAFTVAGPVDAENSFGAHVRSRYICVFRVKTDSAGQHWLAREISVF